MTEEELKKLQQAQAETESEVPDDHPKLANLRLANASLHQQLLDLAKQAADSSRSPFAKGSIIERFKVVSWLLEHAADAKTLLGLYELFMQATTIAEKWDVLKSIGDEIVAIIDTFPITGEVDHRLVGRGSNEDAEKPGLMAMAESKGIGAVDFKTLLEFAQWLLPIIIQLLATLKTPKQFGAQANPV